jgi:DnaJ-domain-containing protein 1
MFDRQIERPKIALMVTMQDDQQFMVNMPMTPGLRLIDVINRTDPFIEVDLQDGTPCLLSKQSIKRMIPVNAPKAVDLPTNKANMLDPHAVLGVDENATAEQIRAAYLKAVKNYHPDRYSASPLPQEMQDYVSSMLQRINAAYRLLAPKDAA